MSPEIVFDQGLGDLFIVRVAGNIAGYSELDSLEYGVKHLNASIILVLGHENCAAVNAVFQNDAGDIPYIAQMIQPAVTIAKQSRQNSLAEAVKSNVRLVVDRIKNANIIRDVLKNRNIKVVGGYYNLQTGAVEILD